MRRIFAQARKELTQIVRDWRTLALALVLPVVLLLLMSTAISLTVNDLPVVVQDFDGSTASHDFIDALRGSITLRVVSWPVDKTADEALASNVARAVLIIPSHFGRDMARGVNSPVQLVVDASDANTAKLVSGYASQIASAYNRQTAGGMEAGPVQDRAMLPRDPLDHSGSRLHVERPALAHGDPPMMDAGLDTMTGRVEGKVAFSK